jgi:hypothetical protein
MWPAIVEVSIVIQHGQVFGLKRRSRAGAPLWAFRYRVGGRGSRHVQRGRFAAELRTRGEGGPNVSAARARALNLQRGRCGCIEAEKRGFAGGVRDLKAP